MALITPEFLQSKTYPAMRDRLAFQHGGNLQAGVWDPNDFKVVQRAAGANMSVDIGSGYALVAATNAGNGGLYHVQNNASVNSSLSFTWPASNGSNPRLDQLVVEINDSQDGADASDVPVFSVLQGTATAGATLDNRTGAAALGNNMLRLADVLVPAASSSITTANIRDRRPWVRGFYNRVIDTGGNYAVTATTFTALSTSRLQMRVECTGNTLRITARTRLDVGAVAGQTVYLAPMIDGVVPTADIGATQSGASLTGPTTNANALGFSAAFMWDVTPTAGSRLVTMASKTSTGTSSVYASDPTFMFCVEELVRLPANNGLT